MAFSQLSRHVLVTVLACSSVVGSVRTVAAQEQKTLSEADRTKAKDHYEKATRFFNVGRYAEAIEEYQNVYLVTADAGMLVNIAQAYRLSEQLHEAARFYKRYLTVAAADAQGRSLAERKLAEVEKLIEERKKVGVVAPPVAPPPAAPAPVAVVPVPPVSPPPVAAAPNPAAEPTIGSVPTPGGPTPAPPSRVIPYTLLVGAGVLTVMAVGFGVVAKSKENALEKAGAQREVFDPNLQKTGKTMNALAVVSGAIGVASGVVGLIFLARSGGSTGDATAMTPSSGRPAFAVQPWLAPGLAGAGARLSF